MSDQKDNGGPAFPFILQGPRIEGDSTGMTLRDYFAAKAPVEDVNHIMVVRGVEQIWW